MAIPTHTIHVYQRPKQGSAFIRRHVIYNYSHSIANQGWFDTASCDLAARSEGEGMGILNEYLGCFVAVYVDNAAAPVWEGLINRITFNAGGASYTISLDEMANRVSVVYTAAANVATETTIVNNTNSQAVYGFKAEQIEFGPDTSAGTQRTVLGNTVLARRAWPQTAVTQAQGNANLIHLECVGIYHTLEWQKLFTVLTTGNFDMYTSITAWLALVNNTTTFFNNADYTKLATTNTTTAPAQQRGINLWERFLTLAEAGDGTNYWIIGISPTDRNTLTRRMYYQQANSAIEYTALQRDGLKPRNAFGKLIPPYLVVPDKVIKVTDMLVGFESSIHDDPTETYIERVQYDANSQRVQWFGSDDTTAQAAFRLKRMNKPLAQPFGAPKRVTVT